VVQSFRCIRVVLSKSACVHRHVWNEQGLNIGYERLSRLGWQRQRPTVNYERLSRLGWQRQRPTVSYERLSRLGWQRQRPAVSHERLSRLRWQRQWPAIGAQRVIDRDRCTGREFDGPHNGQYYQDGQDKNWYGKYYSFHRGNPPSSDNEKGRSWWGAVLDNIPYVEHVAR